MTTGTVDIEEALFPKLGDSFCALCEYDLATPEGKHQFQDAFGQIRARLLRIDLTLVDPEAREFPALFMAKRFVKYVWSNFFIDAMFDFHEPEERLDTSTASVVLSSIQTMCVHLGDLFRALERDSPADAYREFAAAVRCYYQAVGTVNCNSRDIGELT